MKLGSVQLLASYFPQRLHCSTTGTAVDQSHFAYDSSLADGGNQGVMYRDGYVAAFDKPCTITLFAFLLNNVTLGKNLTGLLGGTCDIPAEHDGPLLSILPSWQVTLATICDGRHNLIKYLTAGSRNPHAGSKGGAMWHYSGALSALRFKAPRYGTWMPVDSDCPHHHNQ